MPAPRLRGRSTRFLIACGACAAALSLAACGEDEEPAPSQEEFDAAFGSVLEAQGVPPDLAACLTERMHEEFPVERLEELSNEAQSDPLGAIGPDEQAAMLRILEGCGGPAGLLGLGSSEPSEPAPPPEGGAGAYFDCVAEAGSSAEIERCERRFPP